MFDTLVESGSHSDDLARKGSFFLGTMVVYAVVLVAVAVVGIYLYNDSIPDPSLELLTLVAPAPMQAEEPKQQNEPKPAAKNEPQVAMRQEISVIAPVVTRFLQLLDRADPELIVKSFYLFGAKAGQGK